MAEANGIRKSKSSDPELKKVVSKAQRDLEGWGKKSKRRGSSGTNAAMLAAGGAVMVDGGGYDCGSGADGGCGDGGG